MTRPLIDNESVFDAAPSRQLVYLVLRHRGESTQQEIREAVGLSSRSVRYALEDLMEMDVVERRPRPGDARQDIYALASGNGDAQNADR